VSQRRRSPIVVALTLFMVVATAAQVAVAVVYSGGAARVRALESLDHPYVRVLARPLRLEPGQVFPRARLVDHLRTIGYYQGCFSAPGCYITDDASNNLTMWARYPELPSLSLQWSGDRIAAIASAGGSPLAEARLEPQTLLTLTEPESIQNQTSHEPIPVAAIYGTPLFDAIVASEDRWFLTHHGLDFGRLVLTPFMRSGASTITMQVARMNVLHDRSRTFGRKLSEIGVAMAIERIFSKEAILDAYINRVGLGARGGRPIQGFGAAARAFFGETDVRRLTDLQAATLVALLNQPSRYLDQVSDGKGDGLRRQRNRVLGLMHRNFPAKYSEAWLTPLLGRPVEFTPPPAEADPLQRISRHFLDYAIAQVPAIGGGRIYLTLDAERQRMAVESIEQGLAELQAKVRPGARRTLQAALVAIDPVTGDVLAMVGGRSYDTSQLNRAVAARRQVGSILKPFDYLAALEHEREAGGRALSASTLVLDNPTVFSFGGLPDWKPANYGDAYAGLITWRRALAESRNVAAVKVAALAGFKRVAALWSAASGTPVDHVFPSIALGAIEATPADVAAAYTTFATGGIAHPLRAIDSVSAGLAGHRDLAVAPRRVARVETTDLVTDMMRTVIDEGTGKGIRAAGFREDAAGKTGTTNALRDAWFAGFSGSLLTVVWVGCDDDQPLGLSGAQAAVPIWTAFMKRAIQPVSNPSE
jgi:penicillin-binding protein 1B